MKHSFPKPDMAGVLLVAALLALLPAVLDPFRLSMAGKYAALAFVAIGIVLTWGYGGILSLGQGIFFGLGGYMMAMCLKLEASAPDLPDFMVWSSVEQLPTWWRPFESLPLTLLLVLSVPAVLAYVFSYAVFRKRVGGIYFAIVTLSLALTLMVLIIGQQGDTGGANGITDFRTLLGHDIIGDDAKLVLYWVEAALLTLVMLLSVGILRTRFGKVLVAIRDSENRVRFSGYDTAHLKACVFMLAAVFSSIGGALYSLQVGLISPSVVGVVSSVEMVIFAAVGGRLSVSGAVVGALIVGTLKSLLSESFPESWLYLLGLLFIGVVAVMPMGLAGLLNQVRAPRRAVTAAQEAAR